MKVYLEALGSIDVPWHDQVTALQNLAAKDELGRHILVGDRNAADIVLTLFHVDLRFCQVDRDVKRFAYCLDDTAFPRVPGLYPSLSTWNADPRFARSAPYLPTEWADDDVQLDRSDRRYLFSFVGSSLTSPIRQQILALHHPRALLRDSSGDDAYLSGQTTEVYQNFRQTYRKQLADSSFVLCPRGKGTSSYRLFETMRAGRVPVVISDHWVPPTGVPWDDFLVRVDERDIASISRRMESLAGRAVAMGRIARQHWETNFSETRIFDWMIQQLAEMRSSANLADRDFRHWRMRRTLDWRNFRPVVLPRLKRRIRNCFAR